MGSKIVRRGIAVASVGVLVLLASCSSTSTQVSDEIASQVKEKLDLSTEPGVTCPDDAEAGKGESFTCEIDLDDGQVPVKVTFKDDTNFSTEVEGAVYKKTTLDTELKKKLAEGGVELESFECPGGELVVFKPEGSIECTATGSTGASIPVRVQLTDDKAEIVGSIYERATIEAVFTEQLAGQDVTVAEIQCGEDDLIQVEEDVTIECQAVDSEGATATLEVALGADGTASIENIITD